MKAQYLATLFCLGSSLAQEKSLKIRGISREDEDKYLPNSEGLWACLSNPEILITMDKINDDYCDCPDGSDEPGTAACSNKGQFFCENKGFISQYLPSYKVNDGVCDYDLCCDGSDEAEGVCGNKCEEMRIAQETALKLKEDTFKKGSRIRESMLKVVRDFENGLTSEKLEISRETKYLKRRLKELESIEIDFNELDADKMKIDELFQSLNERINKLTELISEELERSNKYKENLSTLEKTLKDMTDNYNHNFNDPAVKEAAQFYQDYATNVEEETPLDVSIIPAVESLSNDILEIKGKVKPIDSSSEEKTVVADPIKIVDGQVSEECNFQKAFENLVDAFLGTVPKKKVKSDDYERDVEERDPSELSALEIQQEIESIKNKMVELKQKREDINSQFKENYGPDNVLRAYSDRSCINNKIGDYNYKLCPAGLIEQIGSNGQATKIGKFSIAEEDNVKYNEETKQIEINYINGAKCWNGPIRKALVLVECGEKDQILSVSEPEVCAYLFKVSSPMACIA